MHWSTELQNYKLAGKTMNCGPESIGRSCIIYKAAHGPENQAAHSFRLDDRTMRPSHHCIGKVSRKQLAVADECKMRARHASV